MSRSPRGNIHIKTLELQVEELVYKGRGLCRRQDGKVVFVEKALPGETVSCRIIQEKSDWARAEIIEVKKPSPFRTSPFCKYFGRCGGCQFQHLPYEKELFFKHSIFKKIIDRLEEPPEIVRVIGSLKDKEYRARARIFLNQDGFGFRKRESRDPVLIKRCPLFNRALNKGLDRLWTNSGTLLEFHSSIKSIRLSSGLYPEAKIFFEVKKDTLPLKTERIKKAFREAGLDFFTKRDHPEESKGNVLFYKGEFAPKGLFCHGTSFFQANIFQNPNLIDAVISFSREIGGETIMEFFCGSGNFSIPLALSGFRVKGLEISQRAIEYARKNARINDVQKRTRFLKRDVSKMDLSAIKEKIDICLLDPPRTGAKGICKNIFHLNPRGIIYVSCDPMTLKRDLEYLLEQGYRPKKTILIDLFPRTFHIESVTMLLKNR